MPKYIGIDLGTTYTQASVYEKSLWSPDKPVAKMIRFLGAREPDRFPSMVFFPAPGEKPIAGEPAEDELENHPAQVLRESKSYLALETMQRMKIEYPDGVAENRSAEDVSSMILEQAITSMRDVNWNEIQACTITYPASFPRRAISQTMKAAERVSVLRSLNHEKQKLFFLPEPIAAFLGALNHKKPPQFKQGEIILVVDIGAGTTDTTVIRVDDDRDGTVVRTTILEVGEHVLQGGNNYDKAIAEYLCNLLWPEIIKDALTDTAKKEETQVYLLRFWRGLVLMAREVKESLADRSETDTNGMDLRYLRYFRNHNLKKLHDLLDIPERTAFSICSADVNRCLSNLITPEIGNTLVAGLIHLEERFKNSQKTPLTPNWILLAGGGAQVFAVQEALHARYKDAQIYKPLNPHHLIAQGAAVYAGLSDEERDLWRWPVNKDVYVSAKSREGHHERVIWDKIWSREQPEGVYDYKMPNTSNSLKINLGAGFYDLNSNIDRITETSNKVKVFPRSLNEGQPVRMKTWIDRRDGTPYLTVQLMEDGEWRAVPPDLPLEFAEDKKATAPGTLTD
ncbi:MAG: Chaperone protein DnaK [Nitrosomonadaceae bacterium]|nr:Chaperone protein DnaK [Nitrosomonadaceae bacterium]